MKKLMTSLLALLMINSIHAAGGTYCNVDNDSILIDVRIINTHGIPGGPIAQGSVSVSLKEHLSTSWEYDAVEDNIGWWDSTKEIKLSYYKETAKENSFLSIEVTKQADDENAFGVYKFIQNGVVASSGSVSCSYE